jgi:hypothetical protein
MFQQLKYADLGDESMRPFGGWNEWKSNLYHQRIFKENTKRPKSPSVQGNGIENYKNVFQFTDRGKRKTIRQAK